MMFKTILGTQEACIPTSTRVKTKFHAVIFLCFDKVVILEQTSRGF